MANLEHTLDGFTFSLSEGSTAIYVFKGNAFVTAHCYVDRARAELAWKKVLKAKRVVFEK